MGHSSFIVAVCLAGPNLSLLLLSLPFYVTFTSLWKKSSLISHLLTLDVVTLALAKRVGQKELVRSPSLKRLCMFLLSSRALPCHEKTTPMLAFWSWGSKRNEAVPGKLTQPSSDSSTAPVYPQQNQQAGWLAAGSWLSPGILTEPSAKLEPESVDPNKHTGSCPIIRNYLIVFNKSLNFQVFCYEAKADSECFPFLMCAR